MNYESYVSQILVSKRDDIKTIELFFDERQRCMISHDFAEILRDEIHESKKWQEVLQIVNVGYTVFIYYSTPIAEGEGWQHDPSPLGVIALCIDCRGLEWL